MSDKLKFIKDKIPKNLNLGAIRRNPGRTALGALVAERILNRRSKKLEKMEDKRDENVGKFLSRELRKRGVI